MNLVRRVRVFFASPSPDRVQLRPQDAYLYSKHRPSARPHVFFIMALLFAVGDRKSSPFFLFPPRASCFVAVSPVWNAVYLLPPYDFHSVKRELSFSAFFFLKQFSFAEVVVSLPFFRSPLAGFYPIRSAPFVGE